MSSEDAFSDAIDRFSNAIRVLRDEFEGYQVWKNDPVDADEGAERLHTMELAVDHLSTVILEQQRTLGVATHPVEALFTRESPGGNGGTKRSRKRFKRMSDPSEAPTGTAALPSGALLMAEKLAEGGHSRDYVSSFLENNFRNVDVEAAVERVFAAHS
jgi:hypothetical protein